MIHRLRAWEEKGVVLAGKIVPFALPYLRKYQRLLRYLISGGTAAAVDLLFLFLFTDGFGFHYLTSAILAFLVAFVVSFLLQKFWTFQDESVERVHKQVIVYFAVSAVNLLLNTLLMYVLVDWMHIWYMGAQFLASGLIACESFFVSRYVIFNTLRTTKPVRNANHPSSNPPL